MLDVINLALPFFGLIFLNSAAENSRRSGFRARLDATLTSVMWLVKTRQLPAGVFY